MLRVRGKLFKPEASTISNSVAKKQTNKKQTLNNWALPHLHEVPLRISFPLLSPCDLFRWALQLDNWTFYLVT